MVPKSEKTTTMSEQQSGKKYTLRVLFLCAYSNMLVFSVVTSDVCNYHEVSWSEEMFISKIFWKESQLSALYNSQR